MRERAGCIVGSHHATCWRTGMDVDPIDRYESVRTPASAIPRKGVIRLLSHTAATDQDPHLTRCSSAT